MKRGEVWLVNFGEPSGPEQAGIRPAIVLQNDLLSPSVETSIVIPLTTKTKRLSIPTTVFLPAGEASLPEDSVALCHQLQVRGKVRFLSLYGTLSEARLVQVQNAVTRCWTRLTCELMTYLSASALKTAGSRRGLRKWMTSSANR